MIDLHSHILPRMDDGSRSTEESLQMLTALAAQGVTDVAATPHFYASENGPDRFLARRARSWQQLRPHLTASLPRVHLGAEVLFFEGIAAFDGLPRLCISGTDVLLLEMPFRPWNGRMLDELLELVGLGDKLDHYPNQLSGGQQQRVAIARAMVTQPNLLLADEPTGALDQQTGRQVMQLFREINAQGHTIVMITHDGNIAKNASRIVKILDGQLSEGSVEDA